MPPPPPPPPNKPIAQAPLPPPNRPKPTPNYPIPKFNFRVEDLSHPGAQLFFDNVGPNPIKALTEAVLASFAWLYTPEDHPTNVELITLILRPMDGVAYTTGSHTEKEIHFSLHHIKNSESRAKDEINGVLTHEVVHCFQYNAKGTAPGGLIEGIADYVRLHAGLSPPHWKPGGEKWDAGYQTTAYFLDWIENRYGEGTIRELNGQMKDNEWNDDLFKDITGRKVKKLWKMYNDHLEGKESQD